MSTKTTFGAYEVQNMIGKGGMAKVYRCIDTRNGAEVSLKVLKQEKRADEVTLRRFEREIQAMRLVSHPYIVPLLDYSLSPNLSYLVMPYFKGGSVADQILTRLYTPHEAARLLSHLAFALDYAHSQGYIHRDLKPSNFLLDEDGQFYLSDFGLARSIGGSGIQMMRLSGTSPYMAPELENSPADVRSDVYALGIVLCEILSGHRPFEADNDATYAHLHRRAVPPAPSQLNRALPATLDEITLDALHKLPTERPQSAGEFARRFAAVVAVLPPEAQHRAAPIIARPQIMLVPVRTVAEKSDTKSDTLSKRDKNPTLGRLNVVKPPERKPLKWTNYITLALVILVGGLMIAVVYLLMNILTRS